MSANEKLCLKWNDFQINISSFYQDLRDDQDFTDVTLVCGDNHRIEAHKVILASASKVFKNILTGNKHPHPMIFMRGANENYLTAIVDFIYKGETNVFNEYLEGFLALAEDLKLKGLSGNDKMKEERHVEESILTTLNTKAKIQHITTNNVENVNNKLKNPYESTVGLLNKSTIIEAKEIVSCEENIKLDQQINSYMNNMDGIWTCSVCGKTDKGNVKHNLRKHIETHIEGVSHSCDQCGKTFRSRNALQAHNSRNHKNKKTFEIKEFTSDTF